MSEIDDEPKCEREPESNLRENQFKNHLSQLRERRRELTESSLCPTTEAEKAQKTGKNLRETAREANLCQNARESQIDICAKLVRTAHLMIQIRFAVWRQAKSSPHLRIRRASPVERVAFWLGKSCAAESLKCLFHSCVLRSPFGPSSKSFCHC